MSAGTVVTRLPGSARAGPHLVILCGLPFAGKSTLARRLAAALNLMHLEVDAIHGERGLLLEGRPLSRSDWIAAYREAHRRLTALLAGGHVVVYDGVSYRRTHRDLPRRLAARHGAAEIAARRVRNQSAPTRPNVPESEFAEVASRFQPPDPDEAPIRYHLGMPLLALTRAIQLTRGADGKREA